VRRRVDMDGRLLLIIIDGVPYENWRRLFGNLEGWVASGEARVWKMRSVLPSTSASCYASIHTGVTPQVHGVTGNDTIFRVAQPDIFSAVAAARSEEHTSELQSRENLVCRLLLEK